MVVIMLIILQLGASGTDAQTEFRVAYSPQEVCGLRGSWVLMQCSYSLPEGPRFAAGHWYKTNLKTPRDTMFVPPSKGSVEYIITSRICRLRINSLKESDAGIYDFRVTPLTFAQMKDSHGVTLAVSDSLQVKLSSDVVTEGDSVTLTCGASCTLDANTTYVWHKNTNDLPFTMVNMNSSLHLNPVSMEDEGIYSCALRGHEDHPSTAVSLRVRSKMGMIMAVVTGCGMAVLAAAILSCVIICNMRRKHRIMETDSGADTQRDHDTYAALDIRTMSPDYDTLKNARSMWSSSNRNDIV